MPNTELIFEKTSGISGHAPAAKRSGAKRGKGFLMVSAVLAVVVVAGFYTALAPKKGVSGFMLKTWNEAAVTAASMQDTVSTTGVIELKSKETLLSPQTAQVSAVYVAEGDTVRKGQALVQLVTDDLKWSLVVGNAAYETAVRDARMTDTTYEFSIRQQDINIKTAERNLKTAGEGLAQTQGLFERDIASASELASAKNTVADASDSLELARLTKEQTVAKQNVTLTNRETELAQLKKSIADLEESIEECTIRSGMDGRVYSLSAAAGDRLSSYAAVAVIANPSDIQVGIDVAENRINEVRTGNPVSITVGDTAVAGTVKTVASSATASSTSSTSTVRVVAEFEKVPSTAIVGGSVSADIRVGVIEGALTLPRGPYLSSGNYASVYVIDGTSSAAKKTVTFGITDGTYIQVLSGLSEGDRVITSAYQEYIHLAEIGLEKQGERK